MFLETMEQIYGSADKVILDTRGSAPVTYLPLDQLLRRGGKPTTQGGTRTNASGGQPSTSGASTATDGGAAGQPGGGGADQ
jgi:membrane protease subunit HflK